MTSRRAAALAFVALAPMGAFVPTESAAADDCSQRRQQTHPEDGAFLENDVPILKAPNASCEEIGRGEIEDDLIFLCYVSRSDGTWTYLTNRTQNIRGWVSDSKLTRAGSHTLFQP
jgi:hypothetical protein